MQLYIKNMVCDRCRMVVKSVLEQSGVHPLSVALGEVSISETLTKAEEHELDKQLQPLGFALIHDRKSRVVEKIKNQIITLVHDKNNALKTTLSEDIAAAIGQDYSYISSWFSKSEGITIEQYYTLQRIERVKELMADGELNLNEIADRLHYSSASHLTKQFKKVTGVTPTYFKNKKDKQRQPLDNL